AFRAASMRARMAARFSGMLMTAAKLARAAARLNAGLLLVARPDGKRRYAVASDHTFPGRCSLALVTDDERLPDPVAAAQALPKGSLVIIRARNAKRRRALAEMLLAKTNGLILLAADDPMLAGELHGLHLPEAHARDAAHWRALRPHWVITVAAHSARALH